MFSGAAARGFETVSSVIREVPRRWQRTQTRAPGGESSKSGYIDGQFSAVSANGLIERLLEDARPNKGA
jgi:hypothetical protein